VTPAFSEAVERFREDYGAHRAAEGRDHSGAELLSLPYLKAGPLARQWAVRARTFNAFREDVIRPMSRAAGRPLQILDLGAGNGWLSHRLSSEGHDCVAIDIRDDDVDGLGAAGDFVDRANFDCLVASFDDLPIPAASADVAVFNASLHYSTDLGVTIAEAVRVVRPGGKIAILDSPFYARSADGEAMIAEKHTTASNNFGARAENLLALPFIEFLTRKRLAQASAVHGIAWRRRRVRYPLWYEMRPVISFLRRKRAPSRFDLWTATLP
jgi:SAM-dependent methyltransferase